METIVNSAEHIHREFNEAFFDADLVLEKCINSLIEKNESIPQVEYEGLYDNFSSSSSVIKSEKIRSLKNGTKKQIDNLKNLKNSLDDIRLKYPYKIISFAQIVRILEKYDLYIGNSRSYTDIIPQYNAKQISDYLNNIQNKGISVSLDSSYPISSQNYPSYPSYSNNKCSFYICAPHSMFETKDKNIVGREVFYDSSLTVKLKFVPAPIKDPIVLNPLFIDNPLAKDLMLFHIVTAWGPEAKEPDVLNFLEN
jgi:hypothetical protein